MANSKVYLGHARASEDGTKYGVPGNQTGLELRRQEWYKGFTKMFRAKNKDVAEAIAKAMEDAIDNKHIGYSQDDRTTLYEQAKKKNFKIAKVTKDCNCDCSSLVSVCINAAGIVISKDMYTGNEVKLIEQTGQFDTFSSSLVNDSPDWLMRGDILWKNGHTAVILNDGKSVEGVGKIKYYPQYLGKSDSIVDALKAIGVDSSKANRMKIAHANNMPLYAFTGAQNNKLLSMLRLGTLRKPE